MSDRPDLAFGPITPADASAIAAWVPAPADVIRFAGPEMAFPFSQEAFLAGASDSWWIFVLRDRGRLVATGSFGTKGEGEARIGRVLVDPACRGKGYGRSVMEHLIARAFDLPEIDRISLGVYENNMSARTLYEDLGFVDAGGRRTDDVEGEPWIGMRLVLARP